jgi:hypothetical protein
MSQTTSHGRVIARTPFVHLVQFYLPLRDNGNAAIARDEFIRVRDELNDLYGGVTMYSRAPATGLWKDGDETVRDDVIMFEVMVEELDRSWWKQYRRTLEERFRQEEVIVRATTTELL